MSIKNTHDIELLQVAYEIGQYVHSFVTEDPKDTSGKPWSNYSGHFKDGPDPFYSQTRKGLVLEEHCSRPSCIHTPYGELHILGDSSGDWEKVFRAIRGPLGLELIEQGGYDRFGLYNWPLWAITKWKDKKIEKPAYRLELKYIHYECEQVRAIWKKISENF